MDNEVKNIVKEKSNNGLVIALILAILIILGLGCYILYDKEIIFKKDVVKQDSVSANKENEKEKTSEEKDNNKNSDNTKEDSVTDVETKLIVQNSAEESEIYKVELVGNEVVVTSNKIKGQKVEENVLNATVVSYGQTDVGDGRLIIMIKRDGTISAFDMADITIRELSMVNIKRNIASLKGVTKVYNVKSNQVNEYEPAYYAVKATTSNGDIDITNELISIFRG